MQKSLFGTTKTFARRHTYVGLAAKAAGQGRAALGRYPLIGDRLGQCLGSDGFETRIGKVDKAKPIQTKKFAVHTLGHEPSFSAPLHSVWNAAMNRHSGPSVGNAAKFGPSFGRHGTSALCQQRTFGLFVGPARSETLAPPSDRLDTASR